MRKLNILLVEDSKEDAFLIREALEGLTFVDKLHHVENGAMAINFLKKEEPYSAAETPDLILMDINMPVMDGHEALKIIKSIEEVKHVPVIMLTTSSRKEDILRAYQEQSSSYIVKPDDIYELDNLAETIRDYWNNTVRLPRK
ncbi:response regulator [Marivirga harenae]|uniref:response regulator n=1 Tax=Marivirga harenae TaxID=2010992 RepID=UPI0026DF8651|nr:response regulator [Marivirga harenae]WKV13212.1 response regulator [Marivirga harenae]|tara:strand:- start:6148 stop:6576 length:429 start_codon:yes stop_codon:yes gene_type:complete